MNQIIRLDEDTESYILLAIYRNRIIHLFFSESTLMCALYGLSCTSWKNSGVPRDLVISSATFLWNLLSEEVVHDPDYSVEQELGVALKRLIDVGIIKITSTTTTSNLLEISSNSATLPFPALFFCSSLWPFIESYWITCLTLEKALSDSKNFISKPVVIERCLWHVQNLINQGKCLTAESSSKENFSNAITSFKKMGVIKEKNNNIYMNDDQNKFTNLTVLEKLINELRRPTITPSITAVTTAKL